MHGGTEMKRLLIAFFMVLVVHSAYAENYVIFKSDVVEKAINQLVASENRQAAADEYQNSMDPESGKISVTGLYKVCIASGFNIQTNDGYTLCRNFLNFMIAETENMGVGIASQKNCANLFNGVWTISSDGTTYQCVGRDGYELVYNQSCDGADGECITQFSNLQTQGANGREFINAYGKLHGLNLTCHSVIETRRSTTSPLGQDYIKCSAGGKAYEFEFDDLNQTPGDKSSHSENTAICELYGGTIIDTGDEYIEKIWQSCDVSGDLCNGAIHDLALRTGHTNMYQGYCRLSRETETVSVVGLKQIDGIDSRIFYNAGAQMRMDTAKPMAEEYLRTQFPNETYIVCDSSPKKLNEGLGLDIDYVMSCTVGTQQVDFVFDDLSESLDSDAATGIDIMQCIINGGTFNGETCRGLTESECDALDAKLRASGSENGAYYDDDMRACVLGNAMATYQRNVVAGYVVGAVVIVGGTVLTIASGGATAPVVINGVAMLTGDLAINYAIDANHRRLSEKAAKKFVDFVTDAEVCKTEQCALDVLEKHYATLSGVMSDLNTADQAVVDETMDRLIGLIQTEFVVCGENDVGQMVYASPADCAMQQSKLTLLDHIDPISEIVLVIGSVIYDPGYVVTRFTRLKNITKVATVTDNVTDATLSAQRNQLRASLTTSNKIDTETALQIPKGSMAAPINKELEYHDMQILDEQFTRINNDRNLTNAEKTQLKQNALFNLMSTEKGIERFTETSETYRRAMAESLAENPQLYNYMINFDNLTMNQKTDFANKLVREIETKLCDGPSCSNVYVGNFYQNADGDLVFDNSRPTNTMIRGISDGPNMYINATGASNNPFAEEQGIIDNTTIGGFLSTIAHEHDHVINNINPGTAGISKTVASLAESYIVPGTTNLDNIIERSAYTKEYVVSDGIVNEVQNLRNSSAITNSSQAITLQNAKNKLYAYDKPFDKIIDDYLYREAGYPAWWKLSDLSPSEYNALKADLAQRGIQLSADKDGYLRLTK